MTEREVSVPSASVKRNAIGTTGKIKPFLTSSPIKWLFNVREKSPGAVEKALDPMAVAPSVVSYGRWLNTGMPVAAEKVTPPAVKRHGTGTNGLLGRQTGPPG
jgi:hypothetical protein